jgi:hypothetical protein
MGPKNVDVATIMRIRLTPRGCALTLVCCCVHIAGAVQSMPTLQLLRCIQVTVPVYPSASAGASRWVKC